MALKETNDKWESHKNELIEHQHIVDESLQRITDERMRQLELKKERSKLIKQQRVANVERQKRIDEYRRLQTLQKLHETDNRTLHLIQSKSDLVEERKRASIRAKLRKDKVVQAMAEIRLSKKWDSAAKKLKNVVNDDSGKKKKKGKKKRASSAGSRQPSGHEMPRIQSAEAADTSAGRPMRGMLKESDVVPLPYTSPYEATIDKPKKVKERKSEEIHLPTFATDEANLVTF
jgi:hypothetical protein